MQSLTATGRLNQSMEVLKPLKAMRSLMKTTGSNIMASTGMKNTSSAATINYGIIPDKVASVPMKNLYGSITIQDMMKNDAKAQFEGNVPRYPVPDTRSKLYKVHGQVDMSLSKKTKVTYLAEIFDRAKHPNFKKPGPTDYNQNKSFEDTQLKTTKRNQWNKEKRHSVFDDVQAREKKHKGPADYSPVQKVKIPGQYDTKQPNGQLMNEIDFLSAQSPGSNFYKPNYNALSQATRIPRADMNRDKSPKSPLVILKRNDSPSPTSYKDVDTNWKKMSIFSKEPIYTTSKTKKTSFIELN